MIPPHDPIRNGPDGPQFEAIRSVQAGGVHWHVRLLGSGPPLILFLHGSASSGHAWRDVATQLAGLGWSTIAPDLPGHGESRGVPHGGSLGPDALSRALGALLREGRLATGGVHPADGVLRPDLVVGHSVGAVLAIRAASSGQVVPKGILGVNPALGTRRDHIPALLEGPTSNLARRPGPARFLSALFRGAPLAEALLKSTGSRITPEMGRHYRMLLSDPERVRGVLRLQADWDAAGIGAEAGQLPFPVRFLVGKNDRWVPLRLIERERAGVPVRVLPDRGHLLPEEDPAGVVQAIRDLGAYVGIKPLHEAPFAPPEHGQP